MSSAPPHLVILGTGLTALTTSRILLTTVPALSFKLTLLDKAASPGGRINTREYDSGVHLETGARVFLSANAADGSPGAFGNEVERWRDEGWVREVESTRRRGVMAEGRWWEGVGGLSKGLLKGLLREIEEAAAGRMETVYNVQAANPTPVSSSTTPLVLTLTPPTSLTPISFLIHTAPSPQVAALLPPSNPPSTTQYLKTLTLLLPTINVASLPVYHRNPSSRLTAISTGFKSATDPSPAGIVLQSTPEQLGVQFAKEDASDDVVRDAFFVVLRESGLLDEKVIQEAEKCRGRQSQIKRWKFAQIENAVQCPPVVRGEHESEVTVLEGDRVILAGDGLSGGAGGFEGSWRSGVAAAEIMKKWIEQHAQANSVNGGRL